MENPNAQFQLLETIIQGYKNNEQLPAVDRHQLVLLIAAKKANLSMEIDLALDMRDESLFYSLTDELKEIMTFEKNEVL